MAFVVGTRTTRAVPRWSGADIVGGIQWVCFLCKYYENSPIFNSCKIFYNYVYKITSLSVNQLVELSPQKAAEQDMINQVHLNSSLLTHTHSSNSDWLNVTTKLPALHVAIA